MQHPIDHLPLPALRRMLCLHPQDSAGSLAARRFAWLRLKSARRQPTNMAAILAMPTNCTQRSDLPRPAARALRLCVDNTATRPRVAAILAARMLAGRVEFCPELGGAA